MNIILKDRDWSHPLEKLGKKFDECFDNITSEKFHIARGDFLIEWRYLEILWGRLQEDFRIFYENQSQVKEGTVKNFKDNVRIGRFLMCSFDCIHLDTNCFLLNTRILMDRVAHLTTFFWEKISTKKMIRKDDKKKFYSFEKLRNAIKKLSEDEIIDKDYVEYVRLKTDWFENDLRTPRNELVVHRNESHYVEAFKPDSGTVLKGRVRFKDKDGNVVVEYDMRQIPDFNELMDDILAFLKFFDEHFSKMM